MFVRTGFEASFVVIFCHTRLFDPLCLLSVIASHPALVVRYFPPGLPRNHLSKCAYKGLGRGSAFRSFRPEPRFSSFSCFSFSAQTPSSLYSTKPLLD